MRRFLCPSCGNEVYFANTQCVRCCALLGYLPAQDRLQVIPEDMAYAPAAAPCANRDSIACNWLTEDGHDPLCLSCRHTTKIPNISDDKKRAQWARLERSKRRLLYAIIKLKLPLETDPEGEKGFLHFEFLGDAIGKDGKAERVMTGHYQGRITINIAEADDAIREKNRTDMGEPYRTLIGHFRHELGHYYWDKLITGKPTESAFRVIFGDERQDYGEALKAYYKHGPRADWSRSFVSTYASAHPWEDFAETWAHYFHMVGGLETAYAYGIAPQPLDANTPKLVQLEDPYHVEDVQTLIDHWLPLTVAMNAMNRSIGNHDYYPFVLSTEILGKLKFVHDLIAASEVPLGT